MPYRSLLYRALAFAALSLVVTAVAAFALWKGAAQLPAPPPSAATAPHGAPPAAAPTPAAAPHDTLAQAFTDLQHAFAHDGATLTSEHALDATVRLLRRLDAYVEVTWTEESLLLAERRIQHLQALFGLWGLHEDQVALTSATGPARVRVVRYPSLAAAHLPSGGSEP